MTTCSSFTGTLQDAFVEPPVFPIPEFELEESSEDDSEEDPEEDYEPDPIKEPAVEEPAMGEYITEEPRSE